MTTTTHTTGRLRLVDWHDLPHDRIDHLYAAETERWSAALEWNFADGWAEAESRQLGKMGGFVLVDEDENLVGWSFYVVQNRGLQIGSFLAPSPPATRAMLDAILTERVLSSVNGVTFFAFADSPGLGSALRSRGLSVDRYWYLGRDTQRVGAIGPNDARRWYPDDARATAELLSRAYAASDEARPFAPGGGRAEWSDYVRQLADGRGCGPLLPGACFGISGGPGQLLGVALVTRPAENIGHLAQLAIDPRVQGQQFGRRLLDLACDSMSEAGCGRVTLFVGERNSRARRLYETSAFKVTASFLSAGTLHPPRSTSNWLGAPIRQS